VCQQSVGLLQRGLDEAGVPTVSITQVPSITRLVRPSLACFVANPFGLTLGSVGDARTHDRILRAVLAEAERPHPPGTIHPLPFRLAGDLRARQLRKLAH
jgi:D-proline reductase (dithiol) PrdB